MWGETAVFQFWPIAIALLAGLTTAYYYDEDLGQLPRTLSLRSIVRNVLEDQPNFIREDPSWPNAEILRSELLGEVCGVHVDSMGKVFVFHRGSNVWDPRSFDYKNVFQNQTQIVDEPAILVLDPRNGSLLEAFGRRRFILPHGLYIDFEDNIWVTDVALHQVFKFSRGYKDHASLVLGDRFVPGSDETHFCKPTDVAVTTRGIVFVSDGYCNQRVVAFHKNGTFLKAFGQEENMLVVHSLTLLEANDTICAADREGGRVICFDAGIENLTNMGRVRRRYSLDEGEKPYAIAAKGALLFGVRLYQPPFQLPGLNLFQPPTGFVRELEQLQNNGQEDTTQQTVDAKIIAFEPLSEEFKMPHDIVISPDGFAVYIADCHRNSRKRLYKIDSGKTVVQGSHQRVDSQM
ncbi:peptidyl-glycine alpha-amidating monooxygenase-like [Varroa destructor]|uniref:peptidylamidoglycolate lyase n=1 Tax=Varroa destructor TaxID=109461 RepID=A0A7M7MHA7_VARDE|nr:peptidyl-glycine alpha-amidating monooxygenase-like [Varroa destructor]XP_022662036.1 peptidyl-glycine alpha-amidating monooxygenase-like [Varroa destructor]XP_022662037.1 peptidyl-glycine alpha-amidating monooxygenase-like [Varroa destructor]XP_022662038.1 peptidyl-glycine alpha-amidating monooxygenase-like [Varroa destructor]XP_022662039.1 peptidyl-glycine alpha-amidating monooxygenase-like [Varroa destructor]XP_022662040.1 peptidyl-glycine alpha-amidating monooxygenase-like [Varroa destr